MSLYALLLVLLARESAAIPQTMPRGLAAIDVIVDLDATHDEMLLLLAIGHHESRWRTEAVNPHGGDCGPTQVRNAGMWGSSCARLTSDPAEGYRVALRILRHSRAVCPGTWARTLTVYVSGVCGRAPRKARELCRPAGLCEGAP